jgi:hypothetical protein
LRQATAWRAFRRRRAACVCEFSLSHTHTHTLSLSLFLSLSLSHTHTLTHTVGRPGAMGRLGSFPTRLGAVSSSLLFPRYFVFCVLVYVQVFYTIFQQGWARKQCLPLRKHIFVFFHTFVFSMQFSNKVRRCVQQNCWLLLPCSSTAVCCCPGLFVLI